MKQKLLVTLFIGLTGIALAEVDVEKTTMEIYGHVMLDMGYQTGQNNPDWYDVMRPSQLPAYKNQYGADGNFYASVRQTRLGFKTVTPAGDDEIKTTFEFELFGVGVDAGQTTFRLRHAYAEYKQFGAGQYWSVFMDPDVFPNSVEYWGPSGMIFYRNIQFRYMPVKTEQNSVAISLEKPGASGDPGVQATDPSVTGLVAHWPAPDLAVQYRLRYTDLEDQGPAPDDSEDVVGWGLNLSGNYKINEDTVRLQLVYGEGIGNYLNDGAPDIGAGTNPGDVETLPLLGIVAFYDHTWSEKYTSSVGYSMYSIDNSSGQTASAFKRGDYALANLLYHPLPNLMYGVELQYGKRQNKGDGQTDTVDGSLRNIESFDDFRIQFSIKYTFGVTLGKDS